MFNETHWGPGAINPAISDKALEAALASAIRLQDAVPERDEDAA